MNIVDFVIKLTDQTSGPLSNIKNNITKLEGSTMKAQLGVNSLVGAFAGFSAATLAIKAATEAYAIFRDVLSNGKEQLIQEQSALIIFEAQYGTAEAAEKWLNRIKTLHKQIPTVGLNKLVSGSSRLGDAGIKGSQNMDILMQTAALTSSKATMDDLMHNVIQVISAGRLDKRDQRNFSDRGVNFKKRIMDMNKITSTEYEELQKRGKITNDIFLKALASFSEKGGPFYQRLDKMKKSLAGAESFFENSKNNFDKEIFRPFEAGYKKMLNGLSAFMDKYAEQIGGFFTQVGAGFEKLVEIGKVLAEIYKPVFESYLKVFDKMRTINYAPLDFLLRVFKNLAPLIKISLIPLQVFLAVLNALLATVIKIVKNLGSMFNFVDANGNKSSRFKDLKKDFDGFSTSVSNFMNLNLGRFEDFVEAFAKSGFGLGGMVGLAKMRIYYNQLRAIRAMNKKKEEEDKAKADKAAKDGAGAGGTSINDITSQSPKIIINNILTGSKSSLIAELNMNNIVQDGKVNVQGFKQEIENVLLDILTQATVQTSSGI